MNRWHRRLLVPGPRFWISRASILFVITEQILPGTLQSFLYPAESGHQDIQFAGLDPLDVSGRQIGLFRELVLSQSPLQSFTTDVDAQRF